MEFVEENFPTIGFDIDPKKVDSLNAGKSYIKHILQKKLKTLYKRNLKPPPILVGLKKLIVY